MFLFLFSIEGYGRVGEGTVGLGQAVIKEMFKAVNETYYLVVQRNKQGLKQTISKP